jgi:hypothetical protein
MKEAHAVATAVAASISMFGVWAGGA